MIFISSILDSGLHRDFSDLLNTGKITEAEWLSKELSNLLGKPIYFSHFGEPHYPVQNFDAQTVFVHLNPGAGLGDTSTPEIFFKQKWNRDSFVQRHNLNNSSEVVDVLEAYKKGWKNYAYQRFIVNNEFDNFDFKQACFLLHWADSGIDLRSGDLKDRKIQQHNSVNVLNQKLQLELFPYGSNFIDTKSILKAFDRNPDLIRPYIENLLDLLALYPRKYVLFGSRIFQGLFRAYHFKVKPLIEAESPEQKFIGLTKNSLAFSCLRLQWKQKSISVGIAHSFPRRDLPNAYDKMADYGKLCYHHFQDFTASHKQENTSSN
jgi:hypothetical protein